MNYLLELANLLDHAERLGNAEDVPEGTRYIQLSDTLARKIAQNLRTYAKVEELEKKIIEDLEAMIIKKQNQYMNEKL